MFQFIAGPEVWGDADIEIVAPLQVEKYSPDQPRDSSGKWTAGGSSPALNNILSAVSTEFAAPGEFSRDKAGDIVAYHGTRKDVVDSVLKDGLKVTHKENFRSGEFDAALYKGARGESIYLTSSRAKADFYANHASSEHPVIFEVHVPKDKWAEFKRDEFDDTAVRTQHEIPPAWIVKAIEPKAGFVGLDGLGDKVLYQKDDGDDVVAYLVAFADSAATIATSTAKYSPDQPRAPAGGPDGGQWIAGGGGGVMAEGKDAAVALRAKWAAEAKNQTVEDIIRAAPMNQRLLGEAGDEIAKITGAEFKNPGVKTKSDRGVARFKEKIANGRAPANVIDVVRGGFAVSTPEQADQVMAELAKRFPTIDEGWRMNEYKYFDRSAIVKFPDGMMGEIQLMEPSLAKAKSPDGGGGHNLYVQARSLPEGSPVKTALTNQMRSLYGATFAALPVAWKTALASQMALQQSGHS